MRRRVVHSIPPCRTHPISSFLPPAAAAPRAQPDYVHTEFEKRLGQVSLQLNEQGLNVALYWKNKDPRTYINIVPTSAITGEGARGQDGRRAEEAARGRLCMAGVGVGYPGQRAGVGWGRVARSRRSAPATLAAPPRPVLGASCAAGIPDLLQLVVKLTQSLMVDRLMFVDNLEVGSIRVGCVRVEGRVVR